MVKIQEVERKGKGLLKLMIVSVLSSSKWKLSIEDWESVSLGIIPELYELFQYDCTQHLELRILEMFKECGASYSLSKMAAKGKRGPESE